VRTSEAETTDAGGLERSIELLLRLKVHELKGDRGQTEMILLLDSLGFQSGEIIRFLGAPANTVRPILSRAHKKK
jgi:DNA-directed RNA polymerase specialized sigma24 family protein